MTMFEIVDVLHLSSGIYLVIQHGNQRKVLFYGEQIMNAIAQCKQCKVIYKFTIIDDKIPPCPKCKGEIK